MSINTFLKWLNKPKADDKSLLARFYYADRNLTAIANELDSFDGRSEPERCSRLVSKLRQGQDRVLSIINQIMDELLKTDRACRAFRVKFPEEVLQDSLAGQLWFGAECLAAGSAILNRELESTEMRPLAKAVTKSLDNVRNLIREQCLRNNTPNSPVLNLDFNDSATETLYESLKIFDRLFAEFEFLYVSAMVQVKSKEEYEMQEMICVLFSETLQRALKMSLLEQEQIDSFDPALMFSIPRLAIVSGLIIFPNGPLNMSSSDSLSEMFRPFRKLLIKMKDLLRSLTETELHQLEKLLCTNEDVDMDHVEIDFHDEEHNDSACIEAEDKNNILEKKSMISSAYSECYDMNDDFYEDETTLNEDNEYLETAEQAGGFLAANTNIGTLMQSVDPPLSYNLVSNENFDTNDSEQSFGENDTVMPENSETDSDNANTVDKNLDSETSNKNQCDTNENIQEPSTSGNRVEIVVENSKNQKKRQNLSKRTERKSKHRLSSDDLSSTSSNSNSPTYFSSESSSKTFHSSDRSKFKSSENLLHRLFVCIAGVADQLQTNFAPDLRQILRSVFLMNCTVEEEEEPKNLDDSNAEAELFEYQASENNVIGQNNDNSSGSQHSICSGEEAIPESDQSVEDKSEEENLNITEECRYSDEASSVQLPECDDIKEHVDISQAHEDVGSPVNQTILEDATHHVEVPPKWLPDNQAPRCMSCDSQFNPIRRRHHCRRCGLVFCGVCSAASMPLPKFGIIKPVRVCKSCFMLDKGT